MSRDLVVLRVENPRKRLLTHKYYPILARAGQSPTLVGAHLRSSQWRASQASFACIEVTEAAGNVCRMLVPVTVRSSERGRTASGFSNVL